MKKRRDIYGYEKGSFMNSSLNDDELRELNKSRTPERDRKASRDQKERTQVPDPKREKELDILKEKQVGDD
jgi:hypothetical protein